MAAIDDVLLLEKRDRVALVTLHRPEVRNALNTALIDALWEVLPAVDDDPGVRAIVLTGSDPAFCSGLDLGELSGSGENARPRQQRDQVSARGALPPVTTPIVGAVNGAAVTGGLEIAAAIRKDGILKEFVKQRYASWDTGIGAEVESGKADFIMLEKYIHDKGGFPAANTSGRQEMLENLINRYLR